MDEQNGDGHQVEERSQKKGLLKKEQRNSHGLKDQDILLLQLLKNVALILSCRMH